jgi:hypothetical protein
MKIQYLSDTLRPSGRYTRCSNYAERSRRYPHACPISVFDLRASPHSARP